MSWVLAAYQASHRTYGYRRITLHLQTKERIWINHKAVLRLMNKLGIRSVARKRRIFKKVAQLESSYRYPNLLAQDFTATRPNQKWVTDVTYIQTRQGWAYLSTIKDLYDGFIVAHQFGRENSVGLVTGTIRLARQKEKIMGELILHSDQGYQYCTHPYHVLLSASGITASMSRKGNCLDNASMENFFGHLKEEALQLPSAPTFQEARQIIDDYIYFFNYERIQLKTKQTPYQKRCLSG
jgi:transposase InsO family protein